MLIISFVVLDIYDFIKTIYWLQNSGKLRIRNGFFRESIWQAQTFLKNPFILIPNIAEP